MTNFADADEPRMWMDEYEVELPDLSDLTDADFGGEDAYLDSYWEAEAEMAFWD